MNGSGQGAGAELGRAGATPSVPSFDQTDLFRLIYSTEFDQPGGEPYGLLVGDYQIDHRRISGAISDMEV